MRHQLAKFAVQIRADWFDEKAEAGPLILDLKSIEHLEDFDRQFLNLGHYRQAAFYCMVAETVLGLDPQKIQFAFLVAEKSEPFECVIRTPDAAAIAVGRKEAMRDLSTLRTCFETGIWPGAPDEPQLVGLPEWKLKQLA